MSAHGRQDRDGIFDNLQIKGKKVISPECDARLKSLRVNQNVCINGNLTVDGTIVTNYFVPIVDPPGLSCTEDVEGQQHRVNALLVRQTIALDNYLRGVPCHENNGDEALYASSDYFSQYSKGLEHNATTGHVLPASYDKLLTAAAVKTATAFAAVPLAPGAQRQLDNPLGGLTYDLIGSDARAQTMPPAPAFASREAAAEMVELYWMALARDVPFSQFGTEPITTAALAELYGGLDYKGPQPGTAQSLFRGSYPGCTVGPYISQFLYQPCPYGANEIDQRINPPQAGEDYMIDFANWLNIQDGKNSLESVTPYGAKRFMINGRDLAAWVHVDVLYQAYHQAALWLMRNAPLNPTNPYVALITNQRGFASFGGPHIATLVTEVSTRALHAVWYQKWYNHRRLRPEDYGARVDRHKNSVYTYPIHTDLLNSVVLGNVFAEYGSWFLPQAFPEGSPLHPSYGSGHATVAGACVTILKALFDGSFEIPSPVEPTLTGNALVAYVGNLTVQGELNKIATNVAIGRDWAGVHYLTDAHEAMLLGEQVAISTLRDIKQTFKEPFDGWSFEDFSGNVIVI